MLNKKITIVSITILSTLLVAGYLYKNNNKWIDPKDCFNPKYINTIGKSGECKGFKL